MESCINISHPEYRHLKEVSGLPEFTLNAYCRKFLDLRGRFPKLDELPFADSTDYLTKLMEIKEDNSASRLKVLEFTQSSSIPEAIVKLNTDYSDQIIDIKELGDDVIVDIQHRAPATFKLILDESDDTDWEHPLLDNEVNSTVFFNRAVAGLSKKLGIKIQAVTNYDILHTPELRQAIPNSWNVNAFVHNGTIYVNMDNASVDSPIHELMHIFIGSLSAMNPLLYQDLMNAMQQDPDFPLYLSKYLDRTLNDAAEEILVDMFAKYITGVKEDANFFNNPEIYDHIDRMIDTILNPTYSSRSISKGEKMSMSMKLLGLRLHSAAIGDFYTEDYKQLILENSQKHLETNNIKRELIRSQQLLEYCE